METFVIWNKRNTNEYVIFKSTEKKYQNDAFHIAQNKKWTEYECDLEENVDVENL